MKLRALSTLQPGERGTVDHVDAVSAATRMRLMEMGITAGTDVELVRLAPMGDPIEISVRGYRLSLRKSEAANVHVRDRNHA